MPGNSCPDDQECGTILVRSSRTLKHRSKWGLKVEIAWNRGPHPGLLDKMGTKNVPVPSRGALNGKNC